MSTVCLAALLLLAPPPAAPDYSKDPVLLVHGYFLGETLSWTWMKSRLVQAGWPPEYLLSFQFDSVVGCNPKHAQEIDEHAKQLMAATGRDRMDILCHSMGCVDARYWIKYMCGYLHVNDVVCLAGANKGTVTACAEPISCGAKQVCVAPFDGAWLQNPFLKDLNLCDMTPGDDILYTSIWTPYDEIIVPQENATLDGAWNVKLDSLVEHALVLASEESFTYVAAGLDGSGQNDNLPNAKPPCHVVCDGPSVPPSTTEEGGEAPVPDSPGIAAAEDVAAAGDDSVPETAAEAAAADAAPRSDDAPRSVDAAVDMAAADSPADCVAPPLHLIRRRSGGCDAGPRPAGTPAVLLLLLCPLLRGRRSCWARSWPRWRSRTSARTHSPSRSRSRTAR